MNCDEVHDRVNDTKICWWTRVEFQWLMKPWLMQAMLAGIISCMDFSPDDPNMMAAGSYSSVAAVYDVASGSPALVLSGHKGGLTQVCSISAAPVAVYTVLTVHKELNTPAAKQRKLHCQAHACVGTFHPDMFWCRFLFFLHNMQCR